MIWYEVLNYLRTHIQQNTNAEDVIFGAMRPQMLGLTNISPGKVLLIRGTETEVNGDGLPVENTVTVYLECWVRNDEQEMESGYQQLARLEEQIDAALLAIKKESGMISGNIQLMDLIVRSKSGDLDSMRPLIGSQYEIAIDVYESE